MTRYVVSDSVLSQKVLSETVLLDARRGEYFELNQTASRLLDLLRETGNLDRVIQLMADEYAVDESTLRRDMDEVVSKLLEHGLIQRDTPA